MFDFNAHLEHPPNDVDEAVRYSECSVSISLRPLDYVCDLLQGRALGQMLIPLLDSQRLVDCVADAHKDTAAAEHPEEPTVRLLLLGVRDRVADTSERVNDHSTDLHALVRLHKDARAEHEQRKRHGFQVVRDNTTPAVLHFLGMQDPHVIHIARKSVVLLWMTLGERELGVLRRTATRLEGLAALDHRGQEELGVEHTRAEHVGLDGDACRTQHHRRFLLLLVYLSAC